jgi:hypothetical protein
MFKPNKAPPGEQKLLTVGRLRAIRRVAATASERKLSELYRELYGAEAGSGVTADRMRASIKEATDELLNDVPTEPDDDVSDLL